jgi:hypothetical protein
MSLGVEMPRRSQVTPFSVRFEPAIKKIVEKQAKADMRSGAGWIEKIVVEHLKAEGLLKADEDQDESEAE